MNDLLNKFFDPRTLAKSMGNFPNPSLQLLDALIPMANRSVHPRLKLAVEDYLERADNIAHSRRGGPALGLTENAANLKELIVPPFKISKELTPEDINDINEFAESKSVGYDAGGFRQFAARKSVQMRNIFMKSAQAMLGEFLSTKGTINFYEHTTGGKAIKTNTFAFPNASKWQTGTPAALWSSASLIGMYKDLVNWRNQMYNNNGFEGTYTVVMASDVYAQMVEKAGDKAKLQANFPIEFGANYIQLGEFRLMSIQGTYYDYGNYTSGSPNSVKLVRDNYLHMICDAVPRELKFCRLDVMNANGSVTYVDEPMNVRSVIDPYNSMWKLEGQSKPFPLISPSCCLTAKVI